MARGFESKDVEFQQEEARRAKSSGRDLSPAERDREGRRRSLELALTRARADLARATGAAYRTMLTDAIGALEHELRRLRAQ